MRHKYVKGQFIDESNVPLRLWEERPESEDYSKTAPHMAKDLFKPIIYDLAWFTHLRRSSLFSMI